MKRYSKNPYADYLRKNGCKVQILDDNDNVKEEYFRTPDDIAAANKYREEELKNRRVQFQLTIWIVSARKAENAETEIYYGGMV